MSEHDQHTAGGPPSAMPDLDTHPRAGDGLVDAWRVLGDNGRLLVGFVLAVILVAALAGISNARNETAGTPGASGTSFTVDESAETPVFTSTAVDFAACARAGKLQHDLGGVLHDARSGGGYFLDRTDALLLAAYPEILARFDVRGPLAEDIDQLWGWADDRAAVGYDDFLTPVHADQLLQIAERIRGDCRMLGLIDVYTDARTTGELPTG